MKQQKEEQQETMTTSSGKSLSIVLVGELCLVVAVLLMANSASAMNLVDQFDLSAGRQQSVTLAVVEQPELVARVLENLLRSILYSASVDVQAATTTK